MLLLPESFSFETNCCFLAIDQDAFNLAFNVAFTLGFTFVYNIDTHGN